MIYLDNAATTQYKPKEVLDAINYVIRELPYNPNRGGNQGALALAELLYKTRILVSKLVNNGDENRIIFTDGCTSALNTAIFGTAKQSGNIVVSATEHNAVLRCVFELERTKNVTVTTVNPQNDGQITAETLENAIGKNTYLVCVAQASNVTGTVQKHIAELGKIAHKNGALLLVDGAQSVGYTAMDMQQNNVDLFAFGAHKGLHGVQGAGVLAIGKNVNILPTKFGRTGTESHLITQPNTFPEGFEAGTLACPAIVAMGQAIKWAQMHHSENTANIEITQRILLENLAKMPDVTVYSHGSPNGIVAFNVKKADSNIVADMLAENDIAVRGGLQCAPLMHKYLGTFQTGVVRASVSCKTTKRECYDFLNALCNIYQKLK